MSTFAEDEVVTVTPMRTFPVIRDLVTDVSFNYEKARKSRPSRRRGPEAGRVPDAAGRRRAVQEFRKCIECFLCQNVCHVIRDHEENKESFAGPRFLMRIAELEMHPLDIARPARRRPGEHGLGQLQHHQVLHRGVPGEHQDHRQRADSDEGARRRPQVRPAGVAGQQAVPSLSCHAALIRADPVSTLGRRGTRVTTLHPVGRPVMRATTGRQFMEPMRETASINNIRTAIRQLSVRAQLANKEGRYTDAAELENRIQGFREELSHRP